MSFKDMRQIEKPLYHQIASKLAERVAEGYYKEGAKIHTRSKVAQEFAVAPETARKAVQLLEDLGILESRHGSGTYVASRQKARSYVRLFEDVESIESMKKRMESSILRQRRELDTFSMLLDEVTAHTRRTYALNPFIPYELELTGEAAHLGETVSELNIWQQTEGTVVAILRGEKLLLSPGPYAVLMSGDTLYFVGDEYSFQRMSKFFYP